MGAWTYINPLIEEVMMQIKPKNSRVKYIGRSEQASTATGLFSRHVQEQKELVDLALNVNNIKVMKNKN